MKKPGLILLLISLCFVSSAFADVTLQLPTNLNIFALNGTNETIYTTARLPDGLNQIVVRYQGEFGRKDDESEIEYSDVFVVKFEAVDEQLILEITQISGKRDIKKFNRDPQISILTKNGDPIEVHVAKLEKEGMQFRRDYEQELLLFNSTNSPAAVPPGEPEMLESKLEAVKPVHTKEKSTSKISDNSKSSNSPDTVTNQQSVAAAGAPDRQEPIPAEAMLKYWYQQADEETRERFKKWINR